MMTLKGFLNIMWNRELAKPVQQYEKYNPLKFLLITLQVIQQVKYLLVNKQIEHNALQESAFFVYQKTLQVKLGCFQFAQKQNSKQQIRGSIEGFKSD